MRDYFAQRNIGVTAKETHEYQNGVAAQLRWLQSQRMETHIRPEIAALCRLQPVSMAVLAETVGLQKSNLLAAVAGRRPMPAESAAQLWKAIGIDEAGGLAQDRVHHWKVRHSDDLELVERMWFCTVERFALRGEAQSPAHPPLAYLVTGVGATGNQDIFAVVFGRGIDPIAEDRATMPSLPILRIGDISNATLTPEMLRTLLAKLPESREAPTSWAQFVRLAKAEGLTPSGVWNLLKHQGDCI